MDFNDLQERKKRSKKRWNIISFGCFLVGLAPVGAGIFIANMLDILPNIGGTLDIKKAVADVSEDLRNPKPVRDVEKPKKKKTDTGLPEHGGLLIAVGAILSAVFAILGVNGIVKAFQEGVSLINLLLPATYLSIAVGAGVFGVYGFVRKKKRDRFNAYLKLIGDRTAVPIH